MLNIFSIKKESFQHEQSGNFTTPNSWPLLTNQKLAFIPTRQVGQGWGGGSLWKGQALLLTLVPTTTPYLLPDPGAWVSETP